MTHHITYTAVFKIKGILSCNIFKILNIIYSNSSYNDMQEIKYKREPHINSSNIVT